MDKREELFPPDSRGNNDSGSGKVIEDDGGSRTTGAEISCREAGRLGGLSTLQRKGRSHFKNIGLRGQETLARRFEATDRSAWGKRGGRPRKVKACLGEEGTIVNRRDGEPARLSPLPRVDKPVTAAHNDVGSAERQAQ